jgi:hypothetical protein
VWIPVIQSRTLEVFDADVFIEALNFVFKVRQQSFCPEMTTSGRR